MQVTTGLSPDTPTGLRREARRQRLLASALSLFSERGFHDTSVDEVVALARTSKSAFYEYFESKEDCCRVLLEQEGGALIGAVREAASGETDYRRRTQLGIATFIRSCAGRAPVARLLLLESVALSDSIEAVRDRLHAQFAELVESDLRHAQAAGDQQLEGVDPALYGRVVVGAVNEAARRFLADGDGAGDPERLVQGLCKILVP